MTYHPEQIATLKGKAKAALTAWTEDKIDTLLGRDHLVGHYLKRGLRNYLARVDEQADRMIDHALLFVADEQGRVDTDVLIDDLVQLFRTMEVREALLGPFTVHYGAGRIVIDVPHTLLYDLAFGRLGSVTLTADDLLELKDMLQ